MTRSGLPALVEAGIVNARIPVAELTDCHDLRVNGSSEDTVLAHKRGVSPSR